MNYHKLATLNTATFNTLLLFLYIHLSINCVFIHANIVTKSSHLGESNSQFVSYAVGVLTSSFCKVAYRHMSHHLGMRLHSTYCYVIALNLQ